MVTLEAVQQPLNDFILDLRRMGYVISQSYLSSKITAVPLYPYNRCPLRERTGGPEILTVTLADPGVSGIVRDKRILPASSPAIKVAPSTLNRPEGEILPAHNFHFGPECLDCPVFTEYRASTPLAFPNECEMCLLKFAGREMFRKGVLNGSGLQALFPPATLSR